MKISKLRKPLILQVRKQPFHQDSCSNFNLPKTGQFFNKTSILGVNTKIVSSDFGGIASPPIYQLELNIQIHLKCWLSKYDPAVEI